MEVMGAASRFAGMRQLSDKNELASDSSATVQPGEGGGGTQEGEYPKCGEIDSFGFASAPNPIELPDQGRRLRQDRPELRRTVC